MQKAGQFMKTAHACHWSRRVGSWRPVVMYREHDSWSWKAYRLQKWWALWRMSAIRDDAQGFSGGKRRKDPVDLNEVLRRIIQEAACQWKGGWIVNSLQRSLQREACLLDIYTPSPDVCWYEHPGCPRPEFCHDSISFLLWHVSVHGADCEVILPHLLCQPISLQAEGANFAPSIHIPAKKVCSWLALDWTPVGVGICLLTESLKLVQSLVRTSFKGQRLLKEITTNETCRDADAKDSKVCLLFCRVLEEH